MIVCDASTLILLARSELLDIFLADLRGEAVIPSAVREECLVSPHRPDAVLIQERIREGRIVVSSVRDAEVVLRLRQDFHLGRGEAEAIVLALERHVPIVATDDRHAIQACRVLRLGFTTAIGILLRLAERDRISTAEARRCLERLAAYGRYHRTILEDAARRLEGASHGQDAKDAEHQD